MAGSRFIKLGSDPKRIEFNGKFEIEDEFLYEVFKAVGADEYDALFARALTLGAYAFKEERIGAFLGQVESELDGRLEELKMLYKARTLKEKTASKGVEAEEDIGTVLQDHIDERGWQDAIAQTGNSVGTIPRRKVGDLVATIGATSTRVVIESKWDKKVSLGDPVARSSDSEKTAYGQNLTALINREAAVSIYVTDRSVAHETIIGSTEGILFHPEIPAFVAIVDRSIGDWTNLKVAYGIARALALTTAETGLLPDRTALLVKRHIRDLQLVLDVEKELNKIAKSAGEITKSIAAIKRMFELAVESAARSQELLERVLAGSEIAELEWKAFFDEVSS